MGNFDTLFNNYKKHIDTFISLYEQLPDNPSFGQYMNLRNVYYLSRQDKREIKRAMIEDNSLKVHLRDVLEYNFYKIPEFEPIKKFEQVIKFRERRSIAYNVISKNAKKGTKSSQYVSALNSYCADLSEREMATKLSEKFPKETTRPLPPPEELLKNAKVVAPKVPTENVEPILNVA